MLLNSDDAPNVELTINSIPGEDFFPLGSRGRPPTCHHRCTSTTNRLEETCWTPKNHLAENN